MMPENTVLVYAFPLHIHHHLQELKTKFPTPWKAYHLGKMKDYSNLKTVRGQDFKTLYDRVHWHWEVT